MKQKSQHFHGKNVTPMSEKKFNCSSPVSYNSGGFDVVQTRTEFPLKNGFVEINSEHISYTYTVNVLVNNDPTVAAFSTSNLTQVASGSRNYPQSACLQLDLGNSSSVANGVNATIQVVFNGGDGLLYQVKKNFSNI